MHHVMLDHFAAGQTAVHRFDPAAKTVAAVATVLAVVLVRRDHFLPLAPVAAALATYNVLGRMPVRYVLKRLLVVSPFALGVAAVFPFAEPGTPVLEWSAGVMTIRATQEGMIRAAHVIAKFLLAAWAMLLLLGTTRFQDVLQALTRLRLPRALVVQLAFLYRYLWVLMDEQMRLGMARAARDGGLGSWRVRFQSHAGTVGVLFLKTYDRAERIYWAMAARGFDGRVHAPGSSRLRRCDWLFAAAVVAGCGAVLVCDRLVYG